jgi:hypothetical protein
LSFESKVITNDDKSVEVRPHYEKVQREEESRTLNDLERLRPAFRFLAKEQKATFCSSYSSSVGECRSEPAAGDELEALKGLKGPCSSNAQGRAREDGHMEVYTGKKHLGMLLKTKRDERQIDGSIKEKEFVREFYDERAILLSHPKYRLALSFLQHVESGHNSAKFHGIRPFAAHPKVGPIIKDKMAPAAPASQHLEVINARFNRFVKCDICAHPVRIIGPDVEDRIVGLTCDREGRTIIHPTGFDACRRCALDAASGTTMMLADDENEQRSKEKAIIGHLEEYEDSTMNTVKAVADAIEAARIPLPGNSKDYTKAEVTEILQKECR